MTGIGSEIWPIQYALQELKLGNPELEISPESVQYGILGVSLFNSQEGIKPPEIESTRI